jgi:hypothetical protein
MKKLLSILGVIGIVASSSTAVASCGGNPKANDLNADEKNYASATSDLTKMMLLSKSENLGNNIDDVLTGFNGASVGKNSPRLAKRFSSTSAYGTDGNQYASEIVNHYSKWKGSFSSLYADGLGFETSSKFPDSKNSLSTVDVIDQEKLQKDSENVDNSLNYLMSNSIRKSYNGKGTYDINSFVTAEGETNLSEETATLMGVYDLASQGSINDLIADPSADKIQIFMNWISQILPISLTNSGTADSTDTSKGVGQLKQWFFGDASTWKSKMLEANAGGKVGMLSKIYEITFDAIKKNYDKLVSNGTSEELLNLLVGSKDSEVNDAGDYKLITNVINGDTGTDDSKSAGASLDKTWFNAADNTGLYGKLVDAIGNLKFHQKTNNVDGFDKYLTSRDSFGNYNHQNFALADEDLKQVLTLSSELYEVTSAIMQNEDDMQTLVDAIWDSVGESISSAVGIIGLTITKESVNDFIKCFVKIGESFLGYDQNLAISNEMSADEVTNKFSTAFDYDMINQIREASKNMPKESSDKTNPINWFSDSFKNYRETIFKAMGVDVNNNYSVSGAFSIIQSTLRDNADKLFGDASTVGDAKQQLIDKYDKYVIDEKYWKQTNIKVNYDSSGSIVESISYDLEYKGQGNEEVTEFKSSENVLDMSQSEIFKMLGGNDNSTVDNEFKANYNGDGISYQDVDHKYSVEWTNKSINPGEVDFKLSNISNIQAYFNNAWHEMQI